MDPNPSTTFCTTRSFDAPENDGRQMAHSAKQASMYVKYKPAVETKSWSAEAANSTVILSASDDLYVREKTECASPFSSSAIMTSRKIDMATALK